MSATSTIGIKLALDGASQAEASLRRVGTGMEQLSTSAASVRQALGGLAGALAGALSVREFVQAADVVTSLNNSLRLATGSTQAAAKAYTQLFDIAQRSRVSFTELGSTYASISRAGEALGLSQQRLLGVTEAIGNAMSISGGNAAGMQAALTQLSQGLASGALRGDELNSVMEQSPRLAKALADGLGVTTGKLRELGAEGQITAEKVIAALESQAAVLRGEVSSAVLTVGQAFTQLQNASVKAIGDFDKTTGASAALASAISGLATGVQTLGQAFQQNETAIKTTMGVVAGGAAAAGAAALARNVGTVAVAVRALGVALTANPATLALLGIGAAVGGFAAYNEAQKTTEAGIRKTIAALEDLNRAPSIYARDAEGIAAWKKASEERRLQIQKLRADLASLDAGGSGVGSVGSGDTAFARATAAQNSRLAETFEEMRTRLSGFRGDFAKYQADLENIQKLQAAGVITEKQAVGMLTELANKHGEVAKAAKAAAPAVDEFAAALDKVLAKDAGLSSDYDKTLAALFAGYQKGRIGAEAYASAVGKLIEQQPFVKAALDEQVQAAARANELWDEQFAAAEKARLANEDQIKTAREYLDQLEFETSLLGQNAQQRAVATAVRELESKGIKEGTQAYAAYIDKIKEAVRLREGKQAEVKAAEDAAKAWQKASEQIEQSLTDALMRGFESGKGFAEVLRDTVANMFKTLVLRPVVQATVQGGLNAVGLGSLGGQGGGATSLLGAGNLYNSFATSGVGNALGLSTPMVDVLGTGAAGSALTSAGSAVGTALPYVGAAVAVLSLLKSLDDSGTLHTGGLGSYSAAGGTAVGDAVKGQGLSFNLSNESYNASTQQASTQMAQAIVGLLDSTAKTFGQEAGYWAATGFADDTSKDSAWGALAIKMGDTLLADWKNGADKWPGREFADGEAGAREYAAAVALDVRSLLLEQTPEWADTMLRALGDAPTIEQLATTVGQINTAAAALEGMGRASQQFAALTDEATTALLAALGGAEAAVASLSGYYGNFYTETERAGIATAQLTEQLAGLGVALPASREAFRALVDQALEAGNPTLAANLVSLSDEFAALVPATQAAAAAVADTTDAMLASAAELERQQQQQAQAIKELAQQAADAARQSAATMLGALEQANQFFDGFQRSITSFVAGLDAQAGGLPGLRSAGAAYSSQLAFARGGDQDALQGITGYAQTYIDAIRRESTTAAEAALQVGRVRGQLLALPGQVKPEDAIVAALGALGETLTASFDNIDLNVNGLIDYTEFSRAFAGMASDATLQQIFSLLDTNGDGTISRLEAIQGTSQQTADNTYGLDKLSRVKDVIDSLDWGTAGWDASSTRAFATVASQQGWTAQDVSQALNGRFTPEQLQQFFGQYGQNLALGGISGMGSATAGTGAAAGGTATGSGFVVGGGNAGASQGAASYGSAGDIQTVFAQAYINSLDWGNPQVDASSTAALASYAGSAGLSQADLADLLGFTPEQIQQHFAAYGIPAFAVGTNYVPRDMLAMIHEGEAVVPKAYNPVAGGMDFSAFGRGMEAMAAEVRALREENQAQARALVQLQQRQLKINERWDANGLPETRVEA